jgi:hypothetical protein
VGRLSTGHNSRKLRFIPVIVEGSTWCHTKLRYFMKFEVYMAVNIKIKVFDVTSCRLVERLITFRRKLLPPCVGS